MCLQDEGAFTTLVVAVPCRGLPGVVPQQLQAWSSWCCRVLLMCLLVAGGGAPAEFHSMTLQHQCPFFNWCCLCNCCCFLAAAQ